ncbi:MAG: nitroreductase family protein [Acidimicrobiia bacterium]
MADPRLISEWSADQVDGVVRALRRRQSVGRTVEPAPSDEELSTMVACAGRAPDHGGLRPTRYLLVRGAARDRLGEVLASSLARRFPATSAEALTRERGKPLRAPLLVVVVSRLRADVAAVPPLEQLLSSGVAAGYLLLAADALGYGAMWRTGWPVSDPEVRGALGVGPEEAIVGFLYLGTPEGDRVRTAVDQAVGDRVEEWLGPAFDDRTSASERAISESATSETDGGHAEVGFGSGSQTGGSTLAVEVEDDALALAEHPKYRPDEGVRRQDEIAAVDVAHDDSLAGGGIEGLHDALHEAGPPEVGAPTALI